MGEVQRSWPKRRCTATAGTTLRRVNPPYTPCTLESTVRAGDACEWSIHRLLDSGRDGCLKAGQENFNFSGGVQRLSRSNHKHLERAFSAGPQLRRQAVFNRRGQPPEIKTNDMELLLRSPVHQHRDFRVGQYLLSLAAEQNGTDPPPSVGSHDDEIALFLCSSLNYGFIGLNAYYLCGFTLDAGFFGYRRWTPLFGQPDGCVKL
jgi:hypothetical protein